MEVKVSAAEQNQTTVGTEIEVVKNEVWLLLYSCLQTAAQSIIMIAYRFKRASSVHT